MGSGGTGPCETQNQIPLRLLVLDGHKGWVDAVKLSPDGKRLVTVSEDKTAKIWDVTSGHLVSTFPEHGEQVSGVDWSPKGDLVATVGVSATIIWSAANGQVVHRLIANHNLGDSAAFSADGTVLVTAGKFGAVDVWDVASGTLRNRFHPHSSRISSIVTSPTPGSTLVATAGVDHMIKLMDIATGDVVLTIPEDNAVDAVAFSPDGKEIAAGGLDRTARIWDVASGEPRRKITHSSPVASVAFSPDGVHLATATLDGGVHIYDLNDQDLVAMANCRVAAGPHALR